MNVKESICHVGAGLTKFSSVLTFSVFGSSVFGRVFIQNALYVHVIKSVLSLDDQVNRGNDTQPREKKAATEQEC
jgi:hypothetical protein